MAEFVSSFLQLAAMQPAWIWWLMAGLGVLLVAFLFGAGMALLPPMFVALRRWLIGYSPRQAYVRRNRKITEDALGFMDRRDEARRAAEIDQRQRLDAIMKGRAS